VAAAVFGAAAAGGGCGGGVDLGAPASLDNSTAFCVGERNSEREGGGVERVGALADGAGTFVDPVVFISFRN